MFPLKLQCKKINYSGEKTMNESKIEKLLVDLLGEIQLLNISVKTEALKKFKSQFLTSELREQMFNAFDGERTLPQISKDISCKVNTLQIFAQSLIDKDLIDVHTVGSARILKKSIFKIALYYTNRALDNGGNDSGN
jgi:hypothetical protein